MSDLRPGPSVGRSGGVGPGGFRPGDVVAVRKDVWSHEGIVGYPGPDGVPVVIAASGVLGRVVEQPWYSFTGGHTVRHLGYFGTLPRAEVVARARAQVGRAYVPASANCQHLTRFAHGVEVFSWQARACSVGGAALLLWLLR